MLDRKGTDSAVLRAGRVDTAANIFKLTHYPLMLSDDFPEYGDRAPVGRPEGQRLHLALEDADQAWSRAVGAGAEVTMPLADQFWGDRYGQLRDPFGHHWSIGAPSREPDQG